MWSMDLEKYSFYVQKHIAHLAACSGPPASSRRATRVAHVSETRLFIWSSGTNPILKWVAETW